MKINPQRWMDIKRSVPIEVQMHDAPGRMFLDMHLLMVSRPLYRIARRDIYLLRKEYKGPTPTLDKSREWYESHSKRGVVFL